METFRVGDRVRHRQYTEATGEITHLDGTDVQIAFDYVEGDSDREDSGYEIMLPFLLGVVNISENRIIVVNKDLFPVMFEKVR